MIAPVKVPGMYARPTIGSYAFCALHHNNQATRVLLASLKFLIYDTPSTIFTLVYTLAHLYKKKITICTNQAKNTI